MRSMVYFVPIVFLLFIESIQALSGHGLMNPQSACNIRCENGGMCAFSFDDPQIHSCICLLGVYEGDRCQFQVGLPRDSSNSMRHSKYETSTSQRHSPPPRPTPATDYNARQREMEIQREKQRRREYEQRVAAERQEHERRVEAERRRAEESRPIGVLPVDTNREEVERINELRRRDEELRRVAARRREEERRREHEQRLREEERRREFAKQEEQRLRDERRRLEEQNMSEMHQNDRDLTKAKTMEEPSTENMNVDSESIDNDVLLANPDDWDYKSDEEDTTHDYLHGDDHKVTDGDVDIDEHTTTVGNNRASTEHEQNEILNGITKVIEMAADKTVMVHGIEVDKDSTTIGPGDDDYWDHSVKAEYEDFKDTRGTSSHQSSDSAPAPMSDGVQQFTAEEGEEGWMMMKRVGEESSAANVALITVTLTLIFRIW